ncbi:MAG: hypothetical protein M3071_04480 [Actinomycetota bacterium]|nr:hypothetical protein [Actinomycetota bacterium]
MISRLLPVLLVAAVLLVAGCGNSTTTVTGSNGQATTQTHIAFAKTKFLLHAGLAFGAFHHYIYEPLKAGAFAHPLSHKLALAKAALAAAFVIHELKIARMDAQASPLLSKLFSPLTAVAGSLVAVGASLKSDIANSSAIQSVNGAIDGIKSTASSAGAAITETTPPLP